jgi:hypothetical protein
MKHCRPKTQTLIKGEIKMRKDCDKILSKDDFLDRVKGHELTVLMDNGLHRHVRLSPPDTRTCYFDLITYPGALLYTGDMGTFLFDRFDRAEDMFKFFRTPPGEELRINPNYWEEKIIAKRTDRKAIEKYRFIFACYAITWGIRQYDNSISGGKA